MQAHILGEVSIFGTFLLRVYSGTILPIFIEIGSYLTDKEQKISLHSFFETRCNDEEHLPGITAANAALAVLLTGMIMSGLQQVSLSSSSIHLPKYRQ